jgi:hypothetical protein
LNRGKPIFYFSLLILVILTQVTLLHWGFQAIFFVTWLLLALVIRHDSRLSVGLGLVFLAACPFLLIAKKEIVAEQAANFAYFFLAIGVIVQLEEMVLERYSQLNRKIDFSYLWGPPAQSFTHRLREAAVEFERELTFGARAKRIRLFLALGIAGLVVMTLSIALRDTPLRVVILFLGGLILFPFIVWELHSALGALEPAWLLQVAVALVILPLGLMQLVWLVDLRPTPAPPHFTLAYDFVGHLSDGSRTSPVPQGEDIEMRAWTIGDTIKQVLYQHPANSGVSRIFFTIPIVKGEQLAFDVATAPESWSLPGDGVTFAIYAESEAGAQQLFSAYIDPKNNPAVRGWLPVAIDLSSYAGKTIRLIFETGTGPVGDYRNDWAGWGEPRLLKP